MDLAELAENVQEKIENISTEPTYQTNDGAILGRIHGLLEKIENLEVQIEHAAEEPESEWKVYKLQSEIFRHFGIIDWMRERLVSEDVIGTIDTQIHKAKRASDSSDLKWFPIRLASGNYPIEAKNGDVEYLDCFPYTDLIPEIREKILDKLTSPQDKLNILQVFPNEATLMYWNPTNFYLELIFPILKRSGRLSITDIRNLSRVSPHLRHVVVKYYENWLVDDPEVRCHWDYRLRKCIICGIHDAPIDNEVDFCHENPLPVIFKTQVFSRSGSNSEEKSDREWLQREGSRVTYLEFFARRLSRRPGLLFRYLRLVPNLLSLEVDEDEYEELVDSDGEAGNETLDMQNYLPELPELPELPRLRFLRVRGSMSTLQNLLKFYGKRLEYLVIRMGTVAISSLEPIDAPRLSKLKLVVNRPENLSLLYLLLETFENLPLSRICLELKVNKVIFNFPCVMTALSKFGRTLEEMKISVGERTKSIEGTSTWVADLDFPKMRRYSQRNFTGSWTFLLQFPHLEELRLTETAEAGCGLSESVFFEDDNVLLELSWNLEEMYDSNIWKLLPNLENISLFYGQYEDSVREQLNLSRTRCANILRNRNQL